MSHHKFEYDAVCTSCNGTGIYVGFGEHDGAGVVCYKCKGEGSVHHVIEWDDPEGRKIRKGITRVYQCNPGFGIGQGTSEKGEVFKLEDFGGMPYKDWLKVDKFPPKSEMRRFTCPRWYYQIANYSQLEKHNWNDKECDWGAFKDCKHFNEKEQCWERFDRGSKLDE